MEFQTIPPIIQSNANQIDPKTFIEQSVVEKGTAVALEAFKTLMELYTKCPKNKEKKTGFDTLYQEIKTKHVTGEKIETINNLPALDSKLLEKIAAQTKLNIYNPQKYMMAGPLFQGIAMMNNDLSIPDLFIKASALPHLEECKNGLKMQLSEEQILQNI